MKSRAMAPVTLVATDVDGTLTRGGRITAAVLDAFGQLHERGIRVVLVSGRPAGELTGLCRYLPGVEEGIAENGLLAVRPDHAPQALGMRAEPKRLREVGERLNVEHGAGLRLTADAYCRLGDVAYERDGRDAATLSRMRDLAAELGAHLIWSNVHIHLSSEKPDKGRGLLEFARQRGIDPAQVLTIGDAPNDEGLFVPDRFAATVGTADVAATRGEFAVLPDFVTVARESAAFIEMTGRLLRST